MCRYNLAYSGSLLYALFHACMYWYHSMTYAIHVLIGRFSMDVFNSSDIDIIYKSLGFGSEGITFSGMGANLLSILLEDCLLCCLHVFHIPFLLFIQENNLFAV